MEKTIIGAHVVNFYQDLFNVDSTDNGLEDLVFDDLSPHLVTSSKYDNLTSILSFEEIKGVVFFLDLDIAPGLGGFLGSFIRYARI